MFTGILNCTIEEYHNDPCEVPSLSSSIAKLLIDKSALHAHAAHPRLGGEKYESTAAQDAGTLIHRLLLGAGKDIETIDADDYRTNAAKVARDAAKAAGRIPVLARVLEEALAAALVLQKRLGEFGVALSGASEVPVAWAERVFLSDAEVQCRAMFDHVIWSGGKFYDVKKITCAHPDACARAIATYGYDLQLAAYRRAFAAIRPEFEDRVIGELIFVEMEPPYAVLPVKPDGAYRAMGEKRWQLAVERWHACTKYNRWPGYATEPVFVSPPPWALAKAVAEGMEINDQDV